MNPADVMDLSLERFLLFERQAVRIAELRKNNSE